MADKKNAPREQRRASQNTNQTISEATRQVDPDRCDRSCGQCWITYIGTLRWCEVEFLDAVRRELAEILAEGGDRG